MEEENIKDDGDLESLGANKSPAVMETVFKDLAKINGRINRMTTNELIEKLKFYHLDTGGNDDVRRKRLKNNYKKIKIASADLYVSNKLLPYYIIVDFEATCEEVNAPDYRHEIIEFPAVIVNSKTQEIIDTFQVYCKPLINPILSKFCIELTGISQEKADSGVTFQEALNSFEKWLKKHELGTKHKYAIVTDGPWDMSRFLYGQCQISNITYPAWARNWINLRKAFSRFYKCKRFCLKLMLEHVDMSFEGRPHCGLDDARNIARILIRMICDGANIQINEKIYSQKKQSNQKTEENQEAEESLKGKWANGLNSQMKSLKLDAHITFVENKDSMLTYDKIKRERGVAEARIAKQILQESNKSKENNSITNQEKSEWTTITKSKRTQKKWRK